MYEQTNYSTAPDVRTFSAWMRRGYNGLSREQRDTIASASLPSTEARAVGSGNMVQSDEVFTERVIEKIDSAGTGPVFTNATRVETEHSRAITLPVVDDTANAPAAIVENTQITDTTDPTFSAVTMNAYAYNSTMIRCSIQLVQDTAYSLDDALATIIARRVQRGFNPQATTGDGSSKPRGITVAATDSSVAPSAGSNLTKANAIAIQQSLDDAYWTNASWMMAKATWGEALAIDASTSATFIHYENGRAFMLGSPVVINGSMPAPTSGNRAIVYGDLSAYHVRVAGGVGLARFAERYADSAQVGFLGQMKLDGDLADAAAVVYAEYTT